MLEIVRERLDEVKQLETELINLEAENELIIEYNKKLRQLDEAKLQLGYAMNDLPNITDWLPGRKRGQDEYWEGTTGIIRTKKTNRKIISDRVVKQFPFLAGKLARFALKDLEPEISKEELESVIIREEMFAYKPTTRIAPIIPEPKIEKPKKKTTKKTKKVPA